MPEATQGASSEGTVAKTPRRIQAHHASPYGPLRHLPQARGVKMVPRTSKGGTPRRPKANMPLPRASIGPPPSVASNVGSSKGP
jgi:hypothetical protein